MSYIDDLNDAAARAQDAADTAEGASQILYDVANGAVNVTVTTDSGEVKSVAKAIADLEAKFGEGLYGTATEEIVLQEGQTSVTLSSVLTSNMSLFIEGAREFDFAIVDENTFTLPESFPEGTRLWAVGQEFYTDAGSSPVENNSTGTERSLSEWVGGQVYTYATVADMVADTSISLGDVVQTVSYSSVAKRGGNVYNIVAENTGVSDNGSYIDLDNGLQAEGVFPDGINVQQFGADPDNSNGDAAFTAAANYAAEEGASGAQAPVWIPYGGYFISQDMPEAHWYLDAGVTINGLGGLPPTGEANLSRLKGKVYKYNTVEGSRSLYVGDPEMTIQSLTGKAYTAAVCGYSQNGTGGLSGTVFTGVGRDTGGSSAAIKAVAFNNSVDVKNIGWGAYIEGVKWGEAEGATFNVESTSFNFGSYTPWTPYGRWDRGDGETTGATWNLYLTVGGTQQGMQTDTWSTAAIGFKGNEGAKYGRGIVVVGDCLGTKEVVAAPRNYAYTWYHEPTPTTETQVAKISEVGGGDNGNISLAVWNDADESLTSFIVAPFVFRAGSDNVASLGSAAYRWSTVYAGTGSINTSDARKKQQITDPEEAELAVGAKLRIRRFKYNDAVEEKDAESARKHFGFIAQEVIEAFESEGLDAFEYGCVCYDSWDAEDAVIGSEGELITPAVEAGDLYSVRYDECYALMMAAKLGGSE